MLNLLKSLRQDEHGVILSAEIVIVGTVLVLGVMTGMACLQKSVNNELGDFARAIDSIDQTYAFSGHRKAGGFNGTGDCCAFTAGSAFMNNECQTNVCRNDIVGCEGGMILQSEGCGTCGACGGQCSADGLCGSCGISGTAGHGDTMRPDEVSTGVPNMKVTEYPGTGNVPRTTNEGRSPLRLPELEAQPNVHRFESPHNGQIHRSQPFEPAMPDVQASGEAREPLRPVPQTQPLPVTPPPEPQL